ncbi:MAG: ATP-binding protein [Rubrobacteraceae bacterium]
MQVRWRLTIFNALVIGGILVALGFALFFLLRETLLSSIEDTARGRAYAAAQSIASGEGLEEEDGRLELDEELIEGLTLDGVYIVVRDGEGDVITRTINLPAQNEAEDPVWRLALEAGKPTYGTVSLSEEAPDYVYAVPISTDGPARVVEAGKSYEMAEENIQTIASVLAGGVFVAFLLSTIGAYLLARAALSPVGAVVEAARRITEGDLSKRLPVAHPKDEIGRLTTTMNDMLSRLEEAFASREEALARQRRFAADASHELRTPLTSIGGYAKMLEDWALEEPGTAREGVAAIKRESGRMEELVENLLTLTRGDEGGRLDLASNDLAVVAEDAARSARAAAGGKVRVEGPDPERAVNATFDRERIRQAVAILLDNAVKFTPEGGCVRVEAVEVGERAELKVSDTGIGIPEDELPRVFERFYRADKARASGGAGLGLSIAQQIVGAHAGEVRARSKPGEGSTFTISIPRGGPTSRPSGTPRTRTTAGS